MNLFSGLEMFGVNTNDKTDIYKKVEDQPKDEPKAKEKQSVVQPMKEEDYLYKKEIPCTVCGKKFGILVARETKLRRKEPDFDLRPRFEGIDTLKYDVYSCPYCGYTALSRYFTGLTKGQIQLVRENVSSSFRPQSKEVPDSYDYSTAIMRTKMALYNAVVKRGKTSEKAYCCLKLVWMYRDYLEELSDDFTTDRTTLKQIEDEEKGFCREAYEGLVKAVSEEMFPICGMDQNTMDYLLSCLAFELKEYNAAIRSLGNVLTSKTANKRIKDRSLELKEKILSELKTGKN